MRSITIVILLLYARELNANRMDDAQDSADNSLDALTDKAVDELYNRALGESPLQRANLGSTTLGKASHVAMRAGAAATAKAPTCIKYGCSFPNPGSASVNRIMAGMRDARSFAAVGDKFPAVEVDLGFPPEKVNMGKRLADKKSIVVGLPGAFTPV